MTAVGTLPAFIFGAAIEGINGAALGLILWGLLCALAAWAGRRHVRRRSGASASADTSTSTSTTETDSEDALFEQLRRSPCAVCGAPSLLDACLDCCDGWSRPSPRRWDDAASRDEPDDPAR